ncbi:tRNA pseudouridine38-40 synthase [Anaerobranca californiensis DSM 14826]|jgi:tRNA pseudouridine38-40 synthase|uniref:tRNA pseudouridine synthase A n=1 Tax=Anaerobranca californiensis DSM 14826 TaxID=1120989 RepID=A0A1M6MZ88_9FIRM|nr:tRNA pseudouridine(38-40) synthase TruA [Anaerobranca californiensis]SHJ88643.1 tRNA pseudouridine38-40 synthase [Anaerobranca californiensis DSM 14826]
MFNTKLVIAYKGTNYCGFQVQNKSNNPTIQHYLNGALTKIFGEEITTHMASRTDAGVHANGQVVNFKHLKDRLPEPQRLIMAINANLPKDIRVLEAEKVSLDFHSRYNAKGKLYSYTIDNHIAQRPLTKEFTWHVPQPLQLENIKKGAKYFLGTHDFTSFRGSGATTKTTVRTITDFQVLEENRYIKFLIEGNGFLYNMVRIIAGTLIEVGKGKIKAEEIPRIIEVKDRKKAGPTAPPQGLILEKIYY